MAESITWIDPGGTSHAFDGSGNVTAVRNQQGGEQGQLLPKIALLEQRVPLQPGSLVRYVDVQPRLLTYPLLVQAADETSLRTALRNLASWFDTTSAPGTLRATAPDGVSQRDLVCYYAAGLEYDGSYTSGLRAPNAVFLPLQLEAPDPYWYDTAATTAGPYTNTQMGSGVTINNGGQIAVWPTWTIHGPFVNLVITNTTTGKAIKLTANGGINFTSSDTLTINLTPGQMTFLKQDGTDCRGFLTTDSVMWQLVAGNNAITFGYTGGVNGTTTAQASFKNRWWSW